MLLLTEVGVETLITGVFFFFPFSWAVCLIGFFMDHSINGCEQIERASIFYFYYFFFHEKSDKSI